jgi:hypothetical protein
MPIESKKTLIKLSKSSDILVIQDRGYSRFFTIILIYAVQIGSICYLLYDTLDDIHVKAKTEPMAVNGVYINIIIIATITNDIVEISLCSKWLFDERAKYSFRYAMRNILVICCELVLIIQLYMELNLFMLTTNDSLTMLLNCTAMTFIMNLDNILFEKFDVLVTEEINVSRVLEIKNVKLSYRSSKTSRWLFVVNFLIMYSLTLFVTSYSIKKEDTEKEHDDYTNTTSTIHRLGVHEKDLITGMTLLASILMLAINIVTININFRNEVVAVIRKDSLRISEMVKTVPNILHTLELGRANNVGDKQTGGEKTEANV